MLALVWLGGLAAAGPATAVLPEDLDAGTRVSVDGDRSGPGEVIADEVKLRRAVAGLDEIEGAIESVDAAGHRLVVAGVPVALEPGASLRDASGAPLDLAKVRAGLAADAEGRFENGVLRANALEVQELAADDEEDVEIDGVITEVDRAGSSFRVLGIRVRVTPGTKLRLD
jgi:hypothetical protein